APTAKGVEYPYRNLTLDPRRHEPKDWVELYRDGRTVVFGWVKKQPKEKQVAYRQRKFDVGRMGYSRTAVQRVSEEGTPDLAGPEALWRSFVKRGGPRPLESDEAALHVLAFEVEIDRLKNVRATLWQAARMTAALAEVHLGPVPITPPIWYVPSLAKGYEDM